MKKYSIVGLTLFLSGFAWAGDSWLEVKASYFRPIEKAFREIYGEGSRYGVEGGENVGRKFGYWLEVSSFSKRGKLSFTQEATRVDIVALGAGLNYYYAPAKRIQVYGGLGVLWNIFTETNPIGEAKKDGLGPVIRAGFRVLVVRQCYLDFCLQYSDCRMRPADFKINIGGFEAMIGLGYRFQTRK